MLTRYDRLQREQAEFRVMIKRPDGGVAHQNVKMVALGTNLERGYGMAKTHDVATRIMERIVRMPPNQH
jgi:hypothetical protein